MSGHMPLFHTGTILILLFGPLAAFAGDGDGAGEKKKPTRFVRDKDNPMVVRPAEKAPAASRVVVVQSRPAETPKTDEPAAGQPTINDFLRSAVRRRGYAVDGYGGYPFSSSFHPGLYGYGGYFDGSLRSLEDAYIAGRIDEREDAKRRFNQSDMERRSERLLSAHERALRAGLALMRAGEYGRSVMALTLASKLNHGDPACRIHLAQAHMARGHYVEAGTALRRALQLQPSLVYLSLDLADHYPKPEVFGEQVDKLAEAVKKEADANSAFLLGFMQFQQHDFDASHAAFSTAKRLGNKDRSTRAYLEITKPAKR